MLVLFVHVGDKKKLKKIKKSSELVLIALLQILSQYKY